MTAYDYVAFAAMALVFFGLIYLVILLGDLPASVARERGHPQVASIRALAWFGLVFTGGVLWFFAMAWAYYEYRPEHHEEPALQAELAGLRRDLRALETRLDEREGAS